MEEKTPGINKSAREKFEPFLNFELPCHREFIFIVGYNFGTSVSLPLLSLSLFQSPSFSHPQTPQSITLSHRYPPHSLNSVKWKERKGGGKGRER